ncbi:SGNH/GDSL hydrolase family protein [Dyadobacter helix]|nr:GDSL-type esterase/lipase family protein [Dyadobacter sp. CECT 9275]
MTFRIFLLLAFFGSFTFQISAQNDPKWDDTKSKDWPAEAKKVSIRSTIDGSEQPAYFYAATSAGPRPLVISLHTWSGDFAQKDTVVNFCIRKGYNYIHPNFRGPNNKPEACGSDLVVSDIDDAISWAQANSQTDPENIHVIGVSGGGYATVLTYMRSKHKIRSFSAYAGIYNLVDWYHESLGRKAKYAGDIAAATSGNRDEINIENAKKRSPFFTAKPVTDRQNSTLAIYCGIHDGYTGSVPISQSFNMYNKLVSDFNPAAPFARVPQEYINLMIRERTMPGGGDQGKILGRKIIYKNHYQDKISLTVFEGGHEMPPGDVLAHIPSKNILAIGDSNGALEYGWVNQLKTLRPADRIINTCISGNTIGFDNQDKKELNTLRNVDQILLKAEGKPDAVVIMLGTNDCKAIFAGQLKEVPENLDKLIKQIKSKTTDNRVQTPIFIVSPPPFGEDNTLADKYRGGSKRVEYLVQEFRKVAEKNKCYFIDTHSKIKTAYKYLTPDGIHLLAEGQYLLASVIHDEMNPLLNADTR